MALLAGIGRDPEVLVEDGHALSCLALGPSKGLHGVHGLQLVGDRPPVPVLDVGVDELPIAQGLVVAGADGLLLRRHCGLLDVKGIAQGVVRAAHWVARCVALHGGIGVAVDRHVQLRAEHVLVDLAPDTGRHGGGELVVLGQGTRGVDDARGLHLELDGAVHSEVPIARILVVAHCVHGRDNQPSRAAHLWRAAQVGVLPKRADVLLVDADRVLDAPGLAVRGVNPRVQVGDGSLAIATELQLVGVDTEADLAQVEDVLASVRRLGPAIGHNHLRDASTVAHRAAVEADVTELKALAKLESDVQLPLVPLQEPVLQGEGDAFRLRDHKRLERVAAEAILVVLGPVVHGVLRHRQHEPVVDLNDVAGEAIEHQVQALHGVRIVVVQVPEALPEVAENWRFPVDLVPRHPRAAAHRPRLNVEELLVHLQATLGQGRGELCGLGAGRPHVLDVLELDHGPHPRHVVPVHDLPCGNIDARAVGAQLGPLEARGPRHARKC
mmetsp:Transcript_27194/g.61981  ORF Transcript_27194/g.61981 Transcript_27194/m.61981 type:complete len:497 (+) Transcript_27194:456-1946(+)